MSYVTKEEIEKAKEMDLLTYLENYEPYELVHLGGRNYCTREHDSLKISNGKWHWFSRGIGGKTALDYLVKVRNYPFPMAVETIIGKRQPAAKVYDTPAEKPRELKLPELSDTTTNARKYLMSRGIDEEIIDWCIEKGLILETKEYANVVFAGFDNEGTMKYAALRGTRGNFKRDASGSDKRYAFFIAEDKECTALHLFESAIDLLSFATLRKMDGLNWQDGVMLSLAGVYQKAGKDVPVPKALIRMLEENPAVKEIHLHLDTDDVGRGAAIAIQNVLHEKYEIFIEPPKEGKDVNDELMARKEARVKDDLSR